MSEEERCTLCGLHQTCRNVRMDGTYVSRGKGLRVMFILDTPGYAADRRGELLRDEAGTLLKRAVEVFNIGEAYVTACVKCQPPGKKKPKATEIRTCRDEILFDEIAEVDPDILVPCGALSFKALVGNKKISQWSGREYIPEDDIGYRIFPILSPAAIIHDPNKQSAWEQSLERIAKVANGEVEAEPEKTYRLCQTVSDVEKMAHEIIEWAERGGVTDYDFETQGTNPYREWSDTVADSWFIAKHPGATDLYHPETKQLKTTLLTVAFTTESHTGWCVPLFHWDSPWVGQWEEDEVVDIVREILSNPDIKLCAQNSLFEHRWATQHLGVEPRGVVADPMLDQWILDENEPRALKDQAYKHTNMGGYDNEVEGIIDRLIQFPLRKFWEYNVKDTDVTGQIRRKLEIEIAEQELEGVRELTLWTAIHLSRMMHNGIYIEQTEVDRLLTEYNEIIERLEETLAADQMVLVLEALQDRPFKVTSPEMVARVMYGDHRCGSKILKRYEDNRDIGYLVDDELQQTSMELGFGRDLNTMRWFMDEIQDPPEFWVDPRGDVQHVFYDQTIPHFGDGGMPSTDEDALLIIQEISKPAEGEEPDPLHTFAYSIWRHRKALAMRRDRLRLCAGWQNTVDGMVHGDYGQTTETGRLSARGDGKMHNWTRNSTLDKADLPRVKSIFQSRWEGGKIIQADLSQAELRVVFMDALLVDPEDTRVKDAYWEAFRTGKKFDAHTFVATILFQKPPEEIEKWMRAVGKTNNFAMVFQKSLPMFHEELKPHIPNITEDQAKEYMNLYFKRMGAVKTWQKRRNREVVRYGQMATFFGRVRRSNLVNSGDKSKVNAAKRALVNSRIQGTVADLNNLILGMIQEELIENEMESLVVGAVHDSTIIDTHPDEVGQIPYLVRHVMQKIHEELDWITIPMIMDIGIGDNLEDQVDFDFPDGIAAGPHPDLER